MWKIRRFSDSKEFINSDDLSIVYLLKKQKHGYLIYTWSDKAFKGAVVNRTLPFLHGGSLEITLTVPLKQIWVRNSWKEKDVVD